MKDNKKNPTPAKPKLRSYTESFYSLATVVDKKTMDQVHYDLENPSAGTVSLNKLLQQIDLARHS